MPCYLKEALIYHTDKLNINNTDKKDSICIVNIITFESVLKRTVIYNDASVIKLRRVIMKNRKNIINSVKQQFRKYQTRQHLHRLPAHLFKDIACTPQQIKTELHKNRLMPLIFKTLRQLFNRG